MATDALHVPAPLGSTIESTRAWLARRDEWVALGRPDDHPYMDEVRRSIAADEALEAEPCGDCGRLAFYDYVAERCRHLDERTTGCFLIPAEAEGE